MDQSLLVYKELRKIVKMSTFYQEVKQQPSKKAPTTILKKSKKIKEVQESSREDLVQKLKNKIEQLKNDRTTKKDYVVPRKVRAKKSK